MSSPSLELKISHLLKAILDGEKHLENYRKVLLEQALFDPHLTFNYLDQSNLGHISPSVIVNFLKKHDFEVLHIDLIVFFNSYDLSGNCQLSYSDFLNIILPRNCSSAPKPNRSRESSRTPNKRKPTISYEIEWALARLLDKQIAFLKKIEVIKKGLTRHGDFGLLQVFKQIDLNNVGAIDIDSLYVFLKKQKVTTSEDDTVILFRSIDHDNDDLLSYTEFTRVILPASLLAQSSVPNMSTSGMSTRRSSTPLAHRSKPPIGNITPSYAISHQRTPSMDNSKSTPRLSAHQRSYSISEKCNENKIRYNNEIGLLSDSVYRDTSRQQSPSPIYRGPLVQESPRFELYNSEIHSGNTGRKKESETNSVIRGYRVKDLPLARDLKLTPSRKSHSESVKAYREEEMGETEERDLANVLKEMINLDRESENMKNDLALQADLNLFNIFRLFDVEGRGFIDKCELEDGLNMFQVFPTEKELDLIVRRFDRDYDDMLRCSDFCNILTPSNNEYADMLKSRMAYTKNAKKIPETLSIETTFLIRKTLQVIISNESYCECLKHRLNSKQGFTIQKAFKALDNERNGFIRVEDIKQLLNNNGLCASYKEIQGLMHRLTRKQDGRVTYNEFLEEMKPKITTLCD